MTQGNVFRKVSLDRLASPEQLDQLLPVTDSRGWIGLVAAAAVLVAAATWGVLGSIPQNVSGTGMLVKSGGVLEVIPLATGQITDVAVGVGQMVNEGQVVARVAQPELSERLQQGKSQLEELRAQHAQLVQFSEQDTVLQREAIARQKATIGSSIRGARHALRWTADKIVSQERLVEQGLLLSQTLLNTRTQHHAARENLNAARSQLAALEVRELELRTQRETQVRLSENKLAEAERAVAELGRELKSKSEVVSRYTGRVLEIMAEPGGMAAVGEAILRLDRSGPAVKDLVAIIYVPSMYGKQIRVGMSVLVAPSTVKQEEYGLMLAKVTYVSDFPSSWKGMQRVLKNEKLINSLAGGDAPYEVHADLLVDPTTASRYRWSSSKGPPLRIQSGTLATANITVAARRPVELVLPLIREYTGL